MTNWTDVPREEVLAHYRTLTLAELRKHQRIVQAQIPLAYEQRNTAALEDLDYADSCLIEAILARTPKGREDS